MIEYTVKVNKIGETFWKLNGKRHREDGPAIEFADGRKSWYINGELHRQDGPAIEFVDGDKRWYIDGKRHREDGPAIEYADGEEQWYLNGVKLTKEQHKIKTSIVKDHTIKEISEILGYNVRIVKE